MKGYNQAPEPRTIICGAGETPAPHRIRAGRDSISHEQQLFSGWLDPRFRCSAADFQRSIFETGTISEKPPLLRKESKPKAEPACRQQARYLLEPNLRHY